MKNLSIPAISAVFHSPASPERLAAALGASFPTDPQLASLPAITRALRGGPLPDLVLNGTDALFWDQIRRLLAAGSGPAPDHPGCDSRFDFVGMNDPPVPWSMLRLINLLLLLARPSPRAVAVVLSVRNEGVGLLEWVSFYRALGIEHLFIYSNGNQDGSDALLARLDALGVIRHIPNETKTQLHPQRKAYEHALNFLPELRDYRWAFFLDADEFFIPAPRFAFSLPAVVADIESRFADDLPAAVLYNWQFMGLGTPFAWQDGLVLERFPHARPDGQFKSLARLAVVRSMRHLHAPEPIGSGDAVLSGAKRKPFARIWDFDEIDLSGGYIAHYWTKSFEEFSLKKFRGDALIGMPGYRHPREFEQFFAWSVQPRPDNQRPPPRRLVRRVREEMARLLQDSDIRAADAAVKARFRATLAEMGKGQDLAAIYAKFTGGDVS